MYAAFASIEGKLGKTDQSINRRVREINQSIRQESCGDSVKKKLRPQD